MKTALSSKNRLRWSEKVEERGAMLYLCNVERNQLHTAPCAAGGHKQSRMYTLEELLRLVELMEQNASKRADRPGDHTKEGAVDRVHWLAQASAYGEVKHLVKKMIAANKSNNLTTNKI